MADLRVGDAVFDEDGRPCRVTATFDVAAAAPRRLTFSDGSTVDACEDHLWVTWRHADRKAFLRSRHEADRSRPPDDWPTWRPTRHGRGGAPMLGGAEIGPRVRTTAEIAATLHCGRRGDLNHSIPVAAPLRLPAVDLPADPWAVGYWLGNGTTGAPEVSGHAADAEYVLGRIGALGWVGLLALDARGSQCFRVRADAFRYAAKAGKAGVPAPFLRGSVEQRLEVLRGLMDSDGHAGRAQVEFCSTTRQLAVDVHELAASLGQKPVISEGRATLNGADYGPKWRVTWRPTVQVFGSPRKAGAMRLNGGAQAHRNRHRMIVSADPIPPQPMRCISVDSPNAMYLVGRGMIPTHNTRAGAEDTFHYAAWNAGTRTAVVAPTQADLRKTIFEGDSGLLSVIPPECLLGGSRDSSYNSSIFQITLWNGSIIQGFSAEKPDRLRGPQFHRAWCLSGDTPIWMADGTQRPISEIKAGDFVCTRFGRARVAASGMTNPAAAIWEMPGHGLRGTCDHQVFSRRRGFVPLGEIEEFEPLYAFGDRLTYATKPHPTGTFEPVYDLTIEGAHEFFANGILVHNCDELAAWVRLQDTWDNLQFGLRLGESPRVMVTTTPRPLRLVKQLMEERGSIISRSSTYANRANLAASFLEKMERTYEGTRLGRQELHGEVLTDTPNALWTLANIDEHRRRLSDVPPMARIVVAIDPAASNNPGSDETGIVVVGKGTDGHGYVLDDLSLKGIPVGQRSPTGTHERGWADVAVDAYRTRQADAIVAEVNNGGDMVEAVLRGVDANVSYRAVKASRGKVIRAEPVAALYSRGIIHHVGGFPTLEDQMATFTSDYDREKSGYSPDRMDALVWALTELYIEDTGAAGIFDYYRSLAAKQSKAA